jgi:hypothetical protein
VAAQENHTGPLGLGTSPNNNPNLIGFDPLPLRQNAVFRLVWAVESPPLRSHLSLSFVSSECASSSRFRVSSESPVCGVLCGVL